MPISCAEYLAKNRADGGSCCDFLHIVATRLCADAIDLGVRRFGGDLVRFAAERDGLDSQPDLDVISRASALLQR
jgi:hypothetical protein